MKGVSSGFLLGLLTVGFLFSAGSFLIANSRAWSNGGFSSDPANPDYGTHDWIAEHALDWLPVEEKQYILDNSKMYLYGTELPDNGGAPDGIGDTANHHIYYNSTEALTDDVAAVRASAEYNDTLAYLKADDYMNASKNAGIMAHYIADMAVFGHVMGAATDWGAEVHHSDYEDYVNLRTSNYVAEFNSFLSFDGDLAVVSAYEAARELAYDTTLDVGGSLNCTWMDQNYNWSNPTFKNRAGESLNLAVNYVADVLHTLFQESIPDAAYIVVPHHYQIESYYCGPAALEMVFDFYGPDISQNEIADAANTVQDGTYTSDMVRAAHFSNLSTSVGAEMVGSVNGYTARAFGYGALKYNGMTIDQLKSLIAVGYPVIVLTTWHFRVAVGYSSTHITFQDSAWGPMYNMTYSTFDVEWDYASHWAMLVAPWKIELSTSPNVIQGNAFNVTASIMYPAPYPFSTNQYLASLSNATIVLSSGVNLVPGETLTKSVNSGTFAPGDSVTVKWAVIAEEAGLQSVGVEAFGMVTALIPYSYTDRIGGVSYIVFEVLPEETPPTTVDDYDGLWHTAGFTIALTAADTISGVAQTYYRLNDGPVKTVQYDGYPFINVEAADNKLEYWSIDNAGNEEAHHILTGIKLDKTAPIGLVVVNAGETYANSSWATLALTATDATSGVSQVRYSNDGTWDTETWESPSATKTWTLASGDGTKTVYFQIMDYAGLVSLTYSDTIMLDTTVPTVLVLDPLSGDEVRLSTLNITWTGADVLYGINHYEVRFDDGSWNDVGKVTAWVLTDLADGTHTFEVKAVDEARNENQDIVIFVVNIGQLGPGYMEIAVIVAILAIIVLGTLGYVMMKRRKK